MTTEDEDLFSSYAQPAPIPEKPRQGPPAGALSFPPLPSLPEGHITETEREKRTMDYLDKLLGAGDERAIEHLARIAFGTAETPALDRYGAPITKRPSFSEQTMAMDILRTYHRGRPKQNVEVDITDKRQARKWNPDALEMDALAKLREIHQKALPKGVVEGEFTTEGDKKHD